MTTVYVTNKTDKVLVDEYAFTTVQVSCERNC
jgi:hypothetical protein